MSANDKQVGGTHYGGGSRQHWDLVAEFQLDYFQGQITKYVMRWRKKNGIEDLKKAAHFLEKYIELEEKAKLADTMAKQAIADRIVANTSPKFDGDERTKQFQGEPDQEINSEVWECEGFRFTAEGYGIAHGAEFTYWKCSVCRQIMPTSEVHVHAIKHNSASTSRRRVAYD
jgi:hypothetical protein